MKKHSIFNKGFGPLIIIIIIAVVVAGGAGTYQAVKKNKAKVAAEAEMHVEGDTHTEGDELGADLNASTTVVVNTSGTLRGLLARGKDSVCTVRTTTAQGTSEGTVYLSGTNMRGDFTVSGSGGATVASHMIKEGETMYMWSDGGQGIKMDASASAASEGSVQSQSNINLDTAYGYECKDWKKDASKFSIPSSVKFMDLNAMIKAAGEVKMPMGY